MPISKYYGGHGREVMSSMRKTYPSEEKAKEVFYATANKLGQTGDALSLAEMSDQELGDRVQAAMERVDVYPSYRMSEEYRELMGEWNKRHKRASDGADFRSRMHRALDSMLDQVFDKRALRQLQIMRGQAADALTRRG
jgi:hypothetical protein